VYLLLSGPISAEYKVIYEDQDLLTTAVTLDAYLENENTFFIAGYYQPDPLSKYGFISTSLNSDTNCHKGVYSESGVSPVAWTELPSIMVKKGSPDFDISNLSFSWS